jgi:hypothetical protein
MAECIPPMLSLKTKTLCKCTTSHIAKLAAEATTETPLAFCNASISQTTGPNSGRYWICRYGSSWVQGSAFLAPGTAEACVLLATHTSLRKDISLTCSSPIKVLLTPRAKHTVTSSVLLNHEKAIRTSLSVFRLHQLESLFVNICHEFFDFLRPVFSARLICVPRYKTPHTIPQGARMTRNLRVARRVWIRHPHSITARRNTRNRLILIIPFPHLHHLHVEFL